MFTLRKRERENIPLGGRSVDKWWRQEHTGVKINIVTEKERKVSLVFSHITDEAKDVEKFKAVANAKSMRRQPSGCM